MTNKILLLEVVFQVYNNRHLEEERRDLSKERRQAELMTAMTGGAPKTQKTTSGEKKLKSPPASNAGIWGIWQRTAQSHPWDSVLSVSKQ
jgi:hypothetical protein